MSAEYFEARERALLGERYDTLYAAPQETAARGVTVSALRTTPEEFAARADFPLRPSPFCKAAFVVEQPDFKPGRHPYHHAGVFYSQEPSASSAAPLLGVKPGMRVLDLCAAPGGKSSQLAAALQGQGLLVSNEYVAARAEILKSNLERMGVSNAVVLNETPARIAAALPEFFDRVLVDAPCSGEGMFRKEPAALAQHCEALVKQCAELGADILDRAAAALAPGGELVYSTCTFAPEEDEGQVAAFLQRHPEFTLADVLGNVDYPFGMEFESRNDVAEDEYIEMIRLKTAVLLAASLKIGAILAGASAVDAENLYNFGMQIGVAFQLQDDLLDVYGDPEVFGKKIGGDILCNKKTYMLIKALERANGEQLEELNRWLNAENCQPAEKIAAVTEIYNQLTIRSVCENKMREYYTLAMESLEAVAVAEEKKKELKNLVKLLMYREM